ncbi:hypothetical protein GCM10027276_41410 [Comamonas piscis]
MQVVAIAHVFAEVELGALFMHNGFGLAVGVSHGVWGSRSGLNYSARMALRNRAARPKVAASIVLR